MGVSWSPFASMAASKSLSSSWYLEEGTKNCASSRSTCMPPKQRGLMTGSPVRVRVVSHGGTCWTGEPSCKPKIRFMQQQERVLHILYGSVFPWLTVKARSYDKWHADPWNHSSIGLTWSSDCWLQSTRNTRIDCDQESPYCVIRLYNFFTIIFMHHYHGDHISDQFHIQSIPSCWSSLWRK